ncbi:trigger factor [Tropheryma whipplei]|uniref:trigger factor n=1 Tax=Tropheryma whipplei TaxID=2039 RepID=UPI000000C7F9|nr:trigger factor [Tropheryma whipplei]MCO8182996.1 trigger factor [Tropheryma whipplei]MCO8190023.1 trigger factor [Tropheryma whipplei]CAD66955.1 trigger factor [Tropheryma whipplei TW08/27]
MGRTLKSIVQRVSETELKLQVTIPSESLKPHVDRAYREVAKTVSVPGFRRGKVPVRIIDQRIGKHVVLDRAINDCIGDFFQSAVDEQGLTPVAAPKAHIASLPTEPDASLEVVFDVHVYPDVDFPAFENKQIEVDAIDVTDSMVDSEIVGIREKLATFTALDRPAIDGDFLILDLQILDGDKVLSESNAVPYELGSNTLFDGLDSALTSARAGYTTTIDLTPPVEDPAGENPQQDQFAKSGDTRRVKLKVSSVNKRDLPEENDELARLVGGFANLEELRKDSAKNIERSMLFQRSLQARDLLLEQLLSEITFPLPGPIADVLDEIKDEEEKQNRTKQARRDILLDLLAKTFSVTLKEDELERYLSSAAAQRKMSVATLVSVIKSAGQDKYVISDIVRNKALSIALSRVKVIDSAGNPLDISEFTIKTDGDPKVRRSE